MNDKTRPDCFWPGRYWEANGGLLRHNGTSHNKGRLSTDGRHLEDDGEVSGH